MKLSEYQNLLNEIVSSTSNKDNGYLASQCFAVANKISNGLWDTGLETDVAKLANDFRDEGNRRLKLADDTFWSKDQCERCRCIARH